MQMAAAEDTPISLDDAAATTTTFPPEALTDLTIRVEKGHEFQVHRTTLAAASKWFLNWLEQDKTTSVLDVTDPETQFTAYPGTQLAWHTLLKYVYDPVVPIRVEDLYHVILAAHFFHMDALLQRARLSFTTSLSAWKEDVPGLWSEALTRHMPWLVQTLLPLLPLLEQAQVIEEWLMDEHSRHCGLKRTVMSVGMISWMQEQQRQQQQARKEQQQARKEQQQARKEQQQAASSSSSSSAASAPESRDSRKRKNYSACDKPELRVGGEHFMSAFAVAFANISRALSLRLFQAATVLHTEMAAMRCVNSGLHIQPAVSETDLPLKPRKARKKKKAKVVSDMGSDAAADRTDTDDDFEKKDSEKEQKFQIGALVEARYRYLHDVGKKVIKYTSAWPSKEDLYKQENDELMGAALSSGDEAYVDMLTPAQPWPPKGHRSANKQASIDQRRDQRIEDGWIPAIVIGYNMKENAYALRYLAGPVCSRVPSFVVRKFV